MVRMDMRYMWSAIDSLGLVEKRRQPSRGVVLRRSRRCVKGRMVVGGVGGGGERLKVERAVGREE